MAGGSSPWRYPSKWLWRLRRTARPSRSWLRGPRSTRLPPASLLDAVSSLLLSPLPFPLPLPLLLSLSLSLSLCLFILRSLPISALFSPLYLRARRGGWAAESTGYHLHIYCTGVFSTSHPRVFISILFHLPSPSSLHLHLLPSISNRTMGRHKVDWVVESTSPRLRMLVLSASPSVIFIQQR